MPGYVEEELRGYLEGGILCFGFARALCTGCGQAFVVAFSCKGRGVCPSCNGRHMAQTAAHLVDHVIPPVPVRQWVISVPKRLRGMLADRPAAVDALTKIFLDEIERLLSAAAGVTGAANTLTAARPRLGAVSFLHRFGSALNHHVHLHTCVTDGVFVPAPAQAAGDAPPAFLPARPINQADLAALTERVRRRVIRWFRLARLLDAAAAADMLAWVNSGFSVDANVRITLIDRDVPSYFRSLEHLLRYCARPPFALERLSVLRGPDGRIARIRSVLPRHKAATWVGPGRCRKSTRPGDTGVVELTPFAGRMPARRSSQTSALATTAQGGRGQGWHCRRNVSSTVWWISSRRRGSTGTAITEYSRRITSSGGPSRRWRFAMSASSVMRRSLTLSLWEREGVRVLQVRVPRTTQSPARTTRHGLPGRNCWPGWVRSFRSIVQRAAATSG